MPEDDKTDVQVTQVTPEAPAQDAAASPTEDVQATPSEAPDPQTAQDAETADPEGEIDEADPTAIAKFKRREQRLRTERNTAREALAAAQTRVQELEAQMADQENTQTAEQLAAVSAERDAARTELADLKTAQALTGKVVDVGAARKLLDPEKHLTDGVPDPAKLIADYPFLSTVPTTDTAPDGGGGPQNTGGKADEITKVEQELTEAQKRGNRPLAVSLQAKLTALRNP